MTDRILKSPPGTAGSVRIGAVRPVPRKDAPARTGPEAPQVQRPVASTAPAAPAPTPEQAQALARELDALRAAARAKGHEEGKAAALQEFANLERTLKAQLATALAGLGDAHQRLRQDLEQTCIDIAFAAAVKVFGRLSVDAHAVHGAVQQALAQAGSVADVQVRLHPADAQLLGRLLDGPDAPAWPAELGALCADPAIPAGGCVIRSAHGDVDARIETQLASLAELLIQHRDAARVEAPAPPARPHP
jgi:flagellar assembly protein FliH